MSAEVFGVATDTWVAIESIATAVGVAGAGVAAAFAGRQLWYSKQSRIDQNRPYIIVTFEQNEASFETIDIVVRNVGAGPAHNITIKPDPPLVRAVKTSDCEAAIGDVPYFNETIPLMPPAYHLRTFFDDMRDREESGLPKRYDFTVSYDDGHGHFWTEVNIADLGLLDTLLFTEVYGVHHLAGAARDLRDLFQQSPLLKGGVEVTVETRAERSARQRQQYEEHQQALLRLQERNRAAQAATETQEDDPVP
jgi:hypothetical protein